MFSNHVQLIKKNIYCKNNISCKRIYLETFAYKKFTNEKKNLRIKIIPWAKNCQFFSRRIFRCLQDIMRV